jgi:hypothetical protein
MKKLPNQSPLYLPELLETMQNEDLETQIDLVKQYIGKGVMYYNVAKSFTELMVYPEIIWELPESDPPYTPASSHINQGPANLFKVFKEVSRFLRGGGGFIENNQKRQTHFVVTLESLSKQEASLLCQVKNKDLVGYPGLLLEAFVEVYKESLPQEVAESFLSKKPLKDNKQVNGTGDSKTPPKAPAKKSGRPPKNTTKS